MIFDETESTWENERKKPQKTFASFLNEFKINIKNSIEEFEKIKI